ncbi:hypothetical protein EDD85DRAFT_789811 [Armillaria nabsnona]|nr:hypothetical protein EDD85DRAFT_789811 [Armillaria nabsnona]
MQARASTTVIDRVAGLAFPFWCEAIPTYSASQTEEEAWSTLLDAISWKYRAELFFFYPEPGNGPTQTWRPTWKQLMTVTKGFPPTDLDPKHWMNECVDIDDDGDHHFGCHIKEAYIRGLGEVNTDHPAEVRRGKLTIRLGKHTFDIAATHHCLIPDGYYMIIGVSYAYPKLKHWVVGKLRSNKFEKLSTFHIPNKRDRERLGRLDVAFVELATRREEDKIYLCFPPILTETGTESHYVCNRRGARTSAWTLNSLLAAVFDNDYEENGCGFGSSTGERKLI